MSMYCMYVLLLYVCIYVILMYAFSLLQDVSKSKPVLLVISLSGIKVCSSDGEVSSTIRTQPGMSNE